jgi:murein DD-endopeptidase MepM/ murein hydrolase activator NlpD
MLKKRLYTFIVASNSGLWRMALPYPVIVAIGIFALIGIGTAGASFVHYGRMVLKVVDYNRVITENNSFRSENHNYRIQTAQLGEKIDFLETTARKLSNLSGMNSERGVGGVGGYSKDPSNPPLPASAGTLESINKYNKNVASLEESYRSLEEYLVDKALVQSNTPNMMPIRGYVTGGVGTREDPFTGARNDRHTGLDISAPYGTRVYAPADGTVLYAGTREGYGNIVVIDHKFGITSRYGHLSKFNIQVGQHISRHDVIGYVGTTGRTTGPHLHFEIWQFDKYCDPRAFLAKRTSSN